MWVGVCVNTTGVSQYRMHFKTAKTLIERFCSSLRCVNRVFRPYALLHHQGRGLGRNFLRHLRRTRALLHVVDAAAQDPAADYWAVREELRMYNPEYVRGGMGGWAASTDNAADLLETSAIVIPCKHDTGTG